MRSLFILFHSVSCSKGVYSKKITCSCLIKINTENSINGTKTFHKTTTLTPALLIHWIVVYRKIVSLRFCSVVCIEFDKWGKITGCGHGMNDQKQLAYHKPSLTISHLTKYEQQDRLEIVIQRKSSVGLKLRGNNDWPTRKNRYKW